MNLAALGDGPLSEAALREHVWPGFSAALARPGVYLANHSLGRPLDRTALDLAEFAGAWARSMDLAWPTWIAELERFGDRICRLVGLPKGHAALRVSAGQGLRAVLGALGADRPVNVVALEGEFDSTVAILQAYEAAGRARVRWVAPSLGDAAVPRYAAEDLLSAIRPGIDLLVVSHVLFGTGQRVPELGEAIARAHAHGALAVVDMYHSAGVFPVDMLALDADFAIGGSYKYTRGGPGAGWLAVHPRILAEGRATTETGWFARADALEFRRGNGPDRAEGIRGWWESTPAAVAAYQARAGLEFTLALGPDRIRAYSLDRQAELREALRRAGLAPFEPAEPSEFGAFTLLPCDEAKRAVAAAAERGVTADARGRLIRLCPDVLNGSDEFEVAARALAEATR